MASALPARVSMRASPSQRSRALLKRIVVGTDGSDTATGAVREAVDLAKAAGASLHVEACAGRLREVDRFADRAGGGIGAVRSNNDSLEQGPTPLARGRAHTNPRGQGRRHLGQLDDGDDHRGDE